MIFLSDIPIVWFISSLGSHFVITFDPSVPLRHATSDYVQHVSPESMRDAKCQSIQSYASASLG